VTAAPGQSRTLTPGPSAAATAAAKCNDEDGGDSDPRGTLRLSFGTQRDLHADAAIRRPAHADVSAIGTSGATLTIRGASKAGSHG
jgi:hypothetical protein